MGTDQRRPGDDDDGLDPTAEPGLAEAAGFKGCETTAQALNEDRSDAEVAFQDELHEGIVIETTQMVPHPTDGMPTPAGERDWRDAEAPPMTYDTFICCADTREWVEVPGGGYTTDPQRRHKPEEVERDGHGWFVMVEIREGYTTRVNVVPVRLACEHYKRQVVMNSDQKDPTKPGHYIIYRNCTIRRSNGGAYLSLSNEAVYACDYRDPPHLPGEKLADELDENIMRVAEHEASLPEWRT